MHRHRFVEHVGEVELELEADSESELLGAAAVAFAELTRVDPPGEPAFRELELDVPDDHALLLVDWLSELVFLAEVEHFVFERIVDLVLGGGRVRATLAGYCAEPRHVVKAVTLNGLELESKGGSWHGRVVLDV